MKDMDIEELGLGKAFRYFGILVFRYFWST